MSVSGKSTLGRTSLSIRPSQRGTHYSRGVLFLLQLRFIFADMKGGVGREGEREMGKEQDSGERIT